MAERVWIVEQDGTIDAIADRAALDEGRVFIGKRRAKRGDVVRAGEAVRVSERREVDVVVTILHRDDRFVVVDKPAGIVTIPDEHEAEGSLVHRTAREMRVAPEKLHVTSRLDRGVSGVVVFALSERARDQLQNARVSGGYFRRYAAIASKSPSPSEGTWDWPIGRGRDPRKRVVGGRDPQAARTHYRVASAVAGVAILSVEPITGRTHQIRVHASHAGAPLLGDRDYGGSRTLVVPSGKVIALERVALHCAHVGVEGLVDVHAPIPRELREWWTALGGDDAEWNDFA